MNKSMRLLLLLICCFHGFYSIGQVMQKFDGMFTYMSENGDWLAGAPSTGKVIIFNRLDSVYYTYTGKYAIGMGNAITDDGVVVGAMSDAQPAYWNDGEWHPLPLYDYDKDAIVYRADAISADGKRIVGSIGCASWGMDGKQMIAPVLWTMGENGEYDLYKRLPFPQNDFSGRSPQYVTARCISADGKVVFGQVRDFSGLISYQIIYREDENGEWDYELSGLDLLIKEGVEFPQYPSRPKKPKVSDYLTESEADEYTKAMEAYTDSVNMAPLTGKEPSYYPELEDFLKQKKAQYEADYTQYEKEQEKYITDLTLFNDAFINSLTNNQFSFNSVDASGNGRYYTATYIYTAPEELAGRPGIAYTSPICFDLEKEVNSHVVLPYPDMGVATVLDDGTMLCGTPSMYSNVEYARQAWIVPAGTNEYIEFSEWLKGKSITAYNWLKENMTFDYNKRNPGTEAKDSLLTGTLVANNTCDKFLSYLVNPETGGYVSYYIDLKEKPSGKDDCLLTPISVYPNPTTDIVNIAGDLKHLSITDLCGNLLYESSAVESYLSLKRIVSSGVCFLILTDVNDRQFIYKVIVR